MQIETLDQRTINETEARALATLLVAIWPRPNRTVETRTADIYHQWKNYTGAEERYPRSFLIRDGGRIIAHAQADPRTIHTIAGELTVMALSRVCTDPIVRGRGLGEAVVKRAFELVDNGTYPFSLFQTNPTVQPFYEKLGAAATNNRYFNSQADDPQANPFWDTVIMRYPGSGNWPTGDIDINGAGW